ncbi:kinetochore protein NDC80-like protein [Thalictrum thalictroides]|uniref:Kinetochore protein NDC80 n=1 Tax=Thalictrum thalictroides TaxID=46969 RepID=A0A7J6W2J6_THATH|nr:kinetochore protein NDC80-like protein [Thalictrum thalictroides]
MKRGRGRAKNEPYEAKPLINDTPRQFSLTSNRDSDASYGTNRASYCSSTNRTLPVNDKYYQNSALRAINEYLSSHSASFSLKPPLPSAKDIINTIRFIIRNLNWPTDNMKLDEDLPVVLKYLNCPFNLNKSVLKAPGTPHTWPSLLIVIHWLVQIALYNEHISSESTSRRYFFQDNELLMYTLESYSYYIAGDDDAVDALDSRFTGELEQKKEATAEEVIKMEKEVKDLEEKLQAMRSAPSAKEVLEREKNVLEEDVRKFHALIDGFKSNTMALEKDLERMEKELEVKVSENQRICEENEELKKSFEAQMFNLRDVERMRREIQALEREISEAETARNEWEEKSWDLDATLRQKHKELESLSVECNQAMRRLKLGEDMQYKLNRNGSNPADILGNDYKSTLKPALNSFEDELKKSSMAKWEELISFQQKSQDNLIKLKEKRSRLAEVQSQIDAVETQLSLMKKELEDYTSMCCMEANRMTEDYEQEAQKLDTMERKVEDSLKSSSEKLQHVIKQTDEETQMCARELLTLIDSVSKCKEHMESAILDMKNGFSETAEAVANTLKGSLAAEFGSLLPKI